MNFKSIHYFLVTAQERSFTKAASLLHITQQTLSADIAALERELGQPLFLRRVPLQLTYAGEVFSGYAQAFSRSYHAMRQEFDDISKEKTGVLRIGVTYARGHALMPPLIAAFQKRYPRVAIHMVEDSNDRLCQRLSEGEVDLAIANFVSGRSDLQQIPFYRENLVLLVADTLLEELYGQEKSFVLENMRQGSYDALRICPFVLGIPDDIGGNIGRRFLHAQRLQPPVRAQSENLNTILSLCAMGVGACFAPENLIDTALPREQARGLQVIPLPDAEYPIHFGVKKDSYQWQMLREFIAVAQQVLTPSGKRPEESGQKAH